MTPLELGASLYVPATRPNLAATLRRPDLRSVIVCTEDAVRADDLVYAVRNLEAALDGLGGLDRLDGPGPRVYVRPRNQEVLDRLVDVPGGAQLSGIVVPKCTPGRLHRWTRRAEARPHWRFMPILETREAFDPGWLREFADAASRAGGRVLLVRVGGTDLSRCLGVRLPPGRTVYDGPLAVTLARIVEVMAVAGIPLAAPVHEDLDDRVTLAREVETDLAYGFVTKGALTPGQVETIEACFAVEAGDLEEARRILDRDSPAVFRSRGRLCEPATHGRWAECVLRRAEVFGVRGATPVGRTLALARVE